MYKALIGLRYKWFPLGKGAEITLFVPSRIDMEYNCPYPTGHQYFDEITGKRKCGYYKTG
jgi:hypothetical protein